jgi:hypothetical protein
MVVAFLPLVVDVTGEGDVGLDDAVIATVLPLFAPAEVELGIVALELLLVLVPTGVIPALITRGL